MVTRGAEYGNDRIVLRAHYTMDVLAGRTLAEYDLAQLANKTGYVGVKRGDGQIDDFQEELAAARADLTAILEKACGDKIAACAAQDQSRFADRAKNSAFYEATQTYGLPVVFTKNAEATEEVAKLAPRRGLSADRGFPQSDPRAGRCHPDADREAWRWLSRRFRRLFVPRPLQGGRASCGALYKRRIRRRGMCQRGRRRGYPWGTVVML
jgi:hypothetical protein